MPIRSRKSYLLYMIQVKPTSPLHSSIFNVYIELKLKPKNNSQNPHFFILVIKRLSVEADNYKHTSTNTKQKQIYQVSRWNTVMLLANRLRIYSRIKCPRVVFSYPARIVRINYFNGVSNHIGSYQTLTSILFYYRGHESMCELNFNRQITNFSETVILIPIYK